MVVSWWFQHEWNTNMRRKTTINNAPPEPRNRPDTDKHGNLNKKEGVTQQQLFRQGSGSAGGNGYRSRHWFVTTTQGYLRVLKGSDK